MMQVPEQADLAEIFIPTLPPSPYPGLRPFQKAEWPIFFGRERMTDDVIRHLLDRRLVVVHGASGGGKSSLVRAGVQAHLEQQLARAGLRWRTCAMRPGNKPLANLTEALADVVSDGGSHPIKVRRALNQGRGAPAAVTQILGLSATDRLCIVLDQFEELFRFEHEVSRDESTLLAEFLVGFQENPPDGIYVVVTMRSEFLGECARYDGLAETINRTQYLLPRMKTDDLLRAVREPATLCGGRVTERLADRLVSDARGTQDELPLIQHGLSRLWYFASPTEAKAGSVLDLAAYEVRGPLTRLLSEHAESVADRAAGDPLEHRTVEELFRALTDINAEGHAIRRPQIFRDLVAVTGTTTDRLRAILDNFRRPDVSFITPNLPETIEGETTIDISHEALIRCWLRIAEPQQGWLHREFRDGLIWRALVVQAESFAANPKNLLSEATTEARSAWLEGRNEAWARRYGGQWSEVGELIAASSREVARQRQRDEDDRQNAEALRIAQERRAAAERLLEEQQRRAEAESASAAVSWQLAKRRKQWSLAAAVCSVLMAMLSAYAWYSSNQANLERDRAINTQKSAAQAVAGTSDAVEVLHALRTTTDPYQAAVLAQSLAQFSGLDISELTEASEILINTLDKSSSRSVTSANVQALRALWQRAILVGDEFQNQDSLASARQSFEVSLNIVQSLVATSPRNASLQRDLATSLWRMGDVLQDQGNLTGALERFDKSVSILRSLMVQDPTDADLPYKLGLNLKSIGDVFLQQLNPDEALVSYRESLAIFERLAVADPNNTGWQRDLSRLHTKVGDALMQQNKPDAALASYRDSLAIRERLAAADRSDVALRDLSVSYNKVGDVLMAQGNLTEALKSYRESLAIFERLAVADPNNTGWQRDLSRLHTKVGDALMQQNKPDAALASYRDSLAIRERLAAADRSDVALRDLSVSYNKVGDVLMAQGNLTEALKSYHESLAIRERLAKADPNNAGWQRDLAVSYAKVGDVLVAQGNPTDGRAYLQKALAILKQLDEAGRLEPKRKSDITWIEEQLAKLQEAQTTPR